MTNSSSNPWFLLYDGFSVDGTGYGEYCGRTLDKNVAKAHWNKCRSTPYSIGKVIVVTDESEWQIMFDGDWGNFEEDMK